MAKKDFAYEDFILGQDKRCIISTDSYKTQLNNNILVVGGSGSGKTTGVLTPLMLHLQHSNAVGVFNKRGCMQKIAQVLKNKGYRVFTLDFVNSADSEFGYDPFAYCRTDSDFKELAQIMVEGHEKENRSSRDPYWENAAAQLIYFVLHFIRSGQSKRDKSMLSVLNVLDNLHWVRGSEWKIDSFMDSREVKERKLAQYPLHHELQNYARQYPALNALWNGYTALPDSTGACINASVQVPLQYLFAEDTRKILAKKKQFDFAKLLKSRVALLIRISPVSEAQHRFVGLFYHQMFKELFEMAENQPGSVLPYPVHVFCDDFAAGCRIANFDKLISIFREKRLSTTLLIQSESQLSALYGTAKATTIINNCDTYIYLGGMDIQTCKNIGERMRCPADEILNMPIGREYFFRRGQKPIITRRYNLFEDPIYTREFAGSTDKNAPYCEKISFF